MGPPQPRLALAVVVEVADKMAEYRQAIILIP